MLVETSVNVRQVNKAADEQPGDNQQYDRKRNLSDDKRSGQRATRCGRRTAAPVLEGRCELKPRRPECRQHAEQKRRYHRDAEREAEHGQVGGQIQRNWIRGRAWPCSAAQHSPSMPAQHRPPLPEKQAIADSVRSCNTIRRRDAPSAMRIATSRVRATPRARSMLAIFAQAIKSTSATMAIRIFERHRERVTQERDSAASWSQLDAGVCKIVEMLLRRLRPEVAAQNLLEQQIGFGARLGCGHAGLQTADEIERLKEFTARVRSSQDERTPSPSRAESTGRSIGRPCIRRSPAGQRRPACSRVTGCGWFYQARMGRH